MSQILRVNATGIPNITGWFKGAENYTMVCYYDGCEFFLLFRGTGIKMYGRTYSNTLGALHLELDGYPVEIQLNGTTFSDGVAPIYGDENIGDGDHQLRGVVSSLTNGTFLMDHFEMENASGRGFDPLSAGPTAQNVPAQAVIVDNTDPAIIYNNESLWSKYSDGLRDYGRSVSSTSTAGASLRFSFDGVAIWLYGHMCPTCGSFMVSIDGLTLQRLNASRSSNPYDLVQRMIWSNTTLDPGRHTLNITYDDDNHYSGVFLDFFRVLPGAGTPTLSSLSTTTLGELPTTVPPNSPTNQNQTNKVPLVVGLTLGLLVLAVVVICGVRNLRRGRRQIDADSVSPYTGPPTRRSDQQSSMPQVRKGVPQPSGAPMATVDPAISLDVTGLGLPPSYETPSYEWRVAQHNNPKIRT